MGKDKVASTSDSLVEKAVAIAAQHNRVSDVERERG